MFSRHGSANYSPEGVGLLLYIVEDGLPLNEYESALVAIRFSEEETGSLCFECKTCCVKCLIS